MIALPLMHAGKVSRLGDTPAAPWCAAAMRRARVASCSKQQFIGYLEAATGA